MSSLLILGSEGFIGSEIKKKIKKSEYSKVYSLDIKGRKSKKHIKSNINNFNIYNFVIKHDISTIIDLIGCTNHNFTTKNEIQDSLNKNFLDKKNIIKCLKKLNKKVKFITIGSLYKYGAQKKIKKINLLPVNKSQDPQLIFKNKFENKLFNINKNNIQILIINIGSVFGNFKSKDQKSMNLIDQIAFKIKKKIKNTIYVSIKTRYKNCIYIKDAAKLILSYIKNTKLNYLEINIVNNLANFNIFANKLRKKFNSVNIEYSTKNFNYYYHNIICNNDFYKKFIKIYKFN